MRPRAVFFDGVMFLFWAFVCFLYLRLIGFSILLIGLGVLSGLVYGAALALKFIRSLEKNGEFRTSRKTLAFVLFTIIIVVPIAFCLLSTLGLEAAIQMANFIYTVIPAFYAARIILYLKWERKRKKLILFDGLALTRVYAVPITERR